MKTLASVLKAIKTHANKNTKKGTRKVATWPIGKVERQGDVYLIRLAKQEFKTPAKTQQLAPGESKGSRHIVVGGKTFLGWPVPETLFLEESKKLGVSRERLCKELVGPAVVAAKRWKLKHPEHDDFDNPAGVYGTWGQLDTKTLKRVRD
jgi:hypothetical protein